MMVVIPFHVALDADHDQARCIIYETVVTSPFAYLAKPVTVVAAEVIVDHALALQLTAKAYVLDVQYEKAFQTDVVMRVTKAFLTHRMKRPFCLESGWQPAPAKSEESGADAMLSSLNLD